MIVAVCILIIVLALFAVTAFTGSPYVPTLRRDLRLVFDELYPLKQTDMLVDLGSGDGIVVRAARRKKARAIGIELNPILAGVSRVLSWGDSGVSIKVASIWQFRLPPETTVLYTFPNTRDIARLERYVQREVERIGKELYIVSYGSVMPHLVHLRSSGAYHLYKIPLQPLQPQV